MVLKMLSCVGGIVGIDVVVSSGYPSRGSSWPCPLLVPLSSATLDRPMVASLSSSGCRASMVFSLASADSGSVGSNGPMSPEGSFGPWRNGSISSHVSHEYFALDVVSDKTGCDVVGDSPTIGVVKTLEASGFGIFLVSVAPG